MSKFKTEVEALTNIIENVYLNGTSLDEAERLASRFLHAQLLISAELAKSSLDARMRKSGLKAIRAAVYLDEAKKGEKKPTEVMLASLVDTHEVVRGEQTAMDSADTEREELQRLYDVFGNAHIFFRGVAKGTFGSA